MGLKICTIASGSTGNCTYISTPTTTVLVDEGISVTRTEKCLKLLGRGDQLSVLVTHSHSDHISNVPLFARRNDANVYCHYATANALRKKGKYEDGRLIEFSEGDLIVGDLVVTPFRVSHDVPCMGYVVAHKGKRVALATDIGYVGNAVMSKLSGCDLVLLESNHDEGLLRANREYSPWLKSRILSESGHLSNTACAQACVKLAGSGVKQFILAHLSQENNYPELAFNTVSGALAEAGFDDVGVEVARHDKMSSLFEIM